ncbi:nucleoside recognition protein [Novisyntrophococcus fermenticellae]|uniref:nucleoside recognition protein n=1 Tax=Novisyntrophococcus fermenticellae TaxID=2068655 RepID=UPI001E40F3D7|nr:nucleoside recognition protein [Novisyntrophococcus fermenticellae]
MNYLWGGMLLIGIIYGALTGNLQEVTEAAIDSSKEAVSLAVAIAGVTAMWTGLMKIAEETGLIRQMTQKMRPVLKFLFPSVPSDHPAYGQISLNMIANVLGLGWAATPAGLKAMEGLEELNQEECRRLGIGKNRAPHIATRDMCTFLIINISSLQLIPVNIIAYRSQYGSPNPTAILGPAIAATTLSTLAGVIFAKIMYKKE